MRLTSLCPLCSKVLELVSEETVMGEVLQSFKCGHTFGKEELAAALDSQIDYTSTDGRFQARKYQETGVKLLIDSIGNCGGAICGDQMRLGKTPQGLLAARYLYKQAKSRNEEFPILGLVRAANLWQWKRECNTWFNSALNSVWIIQGTKGFIPPGFDIYLMSMDTFGRRGTCKSCEHQFHDEECKHRECNCRTCIPAGDAMSDVLLAFGFKLVIVDEAHSFKNTDSNRSQALTCFLKTIERSETVQEIPFTCMMCKATWTETITIQTSTQEATKRVSKTSHCPKCFSQQSQSAAAHLKVQRNCAIIFLSGTLLKNRADELFVPFNICDPTRFPSITAFRREWLEQDEKGKWSRLKPWRMAEFKQYISKFYFRREKEDVYDSLPALNRIFTVIEITNERLKKAYNQVLDKIELSLANPKYDYFSSIGELQQLRQICGLAKVNWIADYTETILEDSDKQKLAIGIHHHSVRDALSYQLAQFGCLKLSGEDSPSTKDRIMRQFETSPEQILIINMLAGGVGMDFHYCDNILVAERQWSGADEEQFEFRFYNPDKGIKNRPTNVEYILAKGTIDSFFHDMVEEKKDISGETIGTHWELREDPQSFRKLLEQTVAGRL